MKVVRPVRYLLAAALGLLGNVGLFAAQPKAVAATDCATDPTADCSCAQYWNGERWVPFCMVLYTADCALDYDCRNC